MTRSTMWRSVVTALRARPRFRRTSVARHNRAQGTHCFYCHVAFQETGSRQRTVDHRVPRSRKGSDGLVNLVFACRACNQRKADQPEPAFLASEWLQQRRRTVAAEQPDRP